MRDKERERIQTVAGKGATADKLTKYSSLFGDGRVAHRQNSNGRLVHSDQTKELRAKTVKSDHGRHYKKRVLP